MSVAVSLEGCYERIRLAREHLDVLHPEIGEFLDSDPGEAHVEHDVEQRDNIITFKVFKNPPLRWSFTVGEIGYNIRAALDHLVYQLAVWHGSTTVDKDRTQFPIFTDSTDYYGTKRGKGWRARMLKGVAPKHRTMIDREQPFQFGAGAKRTALATLAWFSDKDKHRIHHPAMLTVFGSRFTASGPGLENAEIYVPYEGPPRVVSIEDGTEAFVYRLRIGLPDNHDVSVDGALKIGVGFGDRLLQLGNFDWVITEVERLIQRFAPTVGC